MSKTLTLELPDEVYEAVEEAAEAAGRPPADWIVARLPQLLSIRSQLAPIDQIPRQIYEILEEIAPKMGKSIEVAAAEWLERYGEKPPPMLTKEEARTALERLLRHAGAVNSGDPRSGDNDRVDADLAREYASTHEDEP